MQLQKLASCQGLGAMPGRQATRAPALASQPLARPSTAAFRHQGVHQSARSHVGARDRKVVLVQALTASTASVITENCTEETVKQAVQAHVAGGSKTCHLILMFTAQWCGPCSLVHKELEKLASLRPASSLPFRVLVVDVEANKEFASSLSVASLPTLMFVGTDPSKPCISTVGNVSRGVVSDLLNNRMHLSGADLKNRLRL